MVQHKRKTKQTWYNTNIRNDQTGYNKRHKIQQKTQETTKDTRYNKRHKKQQKTQDTTKDTRNNTHENVDI
jgi:hypothetical protein